MIIHVLHTALQLNPAGIRLVPSCDTTPNANKYKIRFMKRRSAWRKQTQSDVSIIVKKC